MGIALTLRALVNFTEETVPATKVKSQQNITSHHKANYQMYEYMLRIPTPIIRAEASSLTLIQG
jgi:hypothetical protein